ncbi:hypothetical protein [Spirosoma utsteinense]|uniref:PKD/Chitinase domain-containing protein n=1 Tax=Spirosoma utsteinense TaxID=2585773 RepID=A0ABR6WG05_9BACT|nr:hypothetical protein [Spirosoma utsteinense]MBC3789074.1 hypothetical protein [Spirosoma utsteinense]MBC3794981.1 hypothetical protein [Spirosoma utsteinense]
MKQLLQTYWPPVLNFLKWFLAALYRVEPSLPTLQPLETHAEAPSFPKRGYWPVQQKRGENTQETRGPSGPDKLVYQPVSPGVAVIPSNHVKRLVWGILTILLASGLYTAKAQGTLCTSPITYTLLTGQTYTVTAQSGLTNYQWFKNGSAISGATSAAYTVNSIGTYTWTARDAGQCATKECCPLNFIQGACVPPTPIITATPAIICAGSSTNLSVAGCTAGSITWSTGETSAAITITPNTTAVYTVTCGNPQDATCRSQAYQLVTVQPRPNLTVSNAAICAGQTAQLLATGCTGLVTWSNGQTGSVLQVVPATTTQYTATCTDAVCGVSTANGTVTVNSIPTLDLGRPLCTADLTTFSVPFTSTGTVTANLGSLAGGQVIGVPTGQVVTLTATANGCSVSKEVLKDCTCPPVDPPAGQNVSICSDQLQSAILTVTTAAGLQVNWYTTQSGGGPVATNSLTYRPAFAGTYYAEAFNPASGCKSSSRTPITLTVVRKPAVAINLYNKDLQPVTTPNLCVSNQQQITLAATLAPGSAGSFTYEWKSTDDPSLRYLSCKTCSAPVLNIPTAETRSSLTYTVTVTATDGTILCSTDVSTTIDLKQPPRLTITAPVQVICDGSCTTLTVTSDKSVRSAFWTPANLSGTTIRVCPAGSPQGNKDYTYAVNVTDTDGCSTTATATVTVTPTISVYAGEDKTVCQNSATTLTATANLASDATNGNVTIAWSEDLTNPATGMLLATNGTSVNTRTLAVAGVYRFIATVTQSGQNGTPNCVSTDVVQITVTTAPILTIRPTRTDICSDNTMAVTLAATLDGTTPAPASIFWTSTDPAYLAYLSCTNCANPTLTLPPNFTAPTITFFARAVVTTDNNAQCTANAQVIINVRQAPVLTITTPKIICDGSSVDLTVTPNTPGFTYAWTGTAIDQPANGPTVTVRPTGASQGTTTYTYGVNVTNTSGCSASATTTVTVTPSIRVNAGEDQTLCQNSATTLSATANLASVSPNGNVTIAWSEELTNPAMNMLLATNGTSVNTRTLAVAGVYKFIATVTQLSPDGKTPCVATDVVQITVTTAPILTIRPTRTDICNDNTMAVTLAATLDGTTPAPASIFWTSTDPAYLAYLSCTNCANPALTLPPNFTAPTITFFARAVVTTDNNAQCTANAQVIINVRQAPVLTITTPKIICDGSSVDLTVTPNTPGFTYAWTGTAIDQPANGPTVTVRPTGASQGTTTYTYGVNVTNTSGCSASATTTVTVTPSIRVNAGEDQTLCQNSATTLSATANLASVSPNGNVTIAWSEELTNPAMNMLLATNGTSVNTRTLAVAGVYKFIATVTQLSPDGKTPCVATDVVQITVTTAPILTIRPTRTDICNDNTMAVTLAATLDGTTPAPASIFWTSTDPAYLAYLSCTNCANPALTLPPNFTAPTITFFAQAIVTTDNNRQCTANAQVTILIKRAPALTINPPKIICDGSSVQLNVDSNKPVASYEWTGSALSSLTIKSPIAAPAGSLQENKEYTYTVKVTDTDGCFASATTRVTVTPSIRVYAGEDATICQRTTTPLSATTNLTTSPTNGTITVAWTEDAGNTNFGSNLAETAGYRVNTNSLAPGVYKFWATVTQVSPNGITNCVNSDWVQITVTRNPVLTIAPTQPNICPLSQETITLAANLNGGTPAAATIYWTSKDDPTARFLSCSVCANPTLTVPAGYTASTISYTATAIVTADNNIQCPATATVTIIVNPVLKVDAIADVTVCNEYRAVKQSRSTTLRELVSGNPVNIAQYRIEPMVGITNVVVTGATLTFDVMPSNEIVEYTVTLNSAETCYAGTKFYGYETPEPSVEFSMDGYVCLGSKTQVLFNGNAKPGAVYTWDFAGARVLYSNDRNPYDGIAEGPGPHDIQWDRYPGFGNTYVVSLTVNDGGCTATRRKDIRIERGYNVVWNTTNTSVCNGTDGRITLVSALERVTNRDITNTLVFTWTGPNGFSLVAAAPQGSNLTNLAPGTYHVRVDNSIGGCAYEFDLDIKRPKNLGLNALVGYKATCGKTDGGIHTEVVGGTAPYTFYYYDAAGALISQATRSDTLDYKWGLREGKYHVKVVDANQCSTEGDIVLDNIGGPTVEIARITPAPCGENTGKVQFTIFGAAPFSYTLASNDPYPGGTITQAGIPVTLEFLAPGDYVLTVRDANGCVTVKRFTVGAVNSGFNIAVTTTPGACPYNPNGSENPKTGAFRVTSPLGAQYRYTWYGMDGSVFTPTNPTNPTGLATGIYKLKISSNTAGGGVCTDSTTLILNPSEGPRPELVAVSNPTCPDTDNGSVTFIVNKNVDTGTPDKNRFPLTNVGPFSYTLRNTTSQDGLVRSGTVVDNTNLTVTVWPKAPTCSPLRIGTSA